MKLFLCFLAKFARLTGRARAGAGAAEAGVTKGEVSVSIEAKVCYSVFVTPPLGGGGSKQVKQDPVRCTKEAI